MNQNKPIEWVAADTRLPALGLTTSGKRTSAAVLVVSGGVVFEATLTELRGRRPVFVRPSGYKLRDVTHWAPMPQPPNH